MCWHGFLKGWLEIYVKFITKDRALPLETNVVWLTLMLIIIIAFKIQMPLAMSFFLLTKQSVEKSPHSFF